MTPDKNQPKSSRQEQPAQNNNTGSWLAVGLSLGTFVGILTDNIGAGMMFGVAAGLCAAPAIAALKGRHKPDEPPHREEK